MKSIFKKYVQDTVSCILYFQDTFKSILHNSRQFWHDIAIITGDCVVVKPDQRLDDVRYWEKEVDEKLAALKGETEALDMYRNRLNLAIEAYEEPLRIAQLCLVNRSVNFWLYGLTLTPDEFVKLLN